MIPQMTVVADLTRSGDWLRLKPGYAVGDCHARRLPSVHEGRVPVWPLPLQPPRMSCVGIWVGQVVGLAHSLKDGGLRQRHTGAGSALPPPFPPPNWIRCGWMASVCRMHYPENVNTRRHFVTGS